MACGMISLDSIKNLTISTDDIFGMMFASLGFGVRVASQSSLTYKHTFTMEEYIYVY